MRGQKEMEKLFIELKHQNVNWIMIAQLIAICTQPSMFPDEIKKGQKITYA